MICVVVERSDRSLRRHCSAGLSVLGRDHRWARLSRDRTRVRFPSTAFGLGTSRRGWPLPVLRGSQPNDLDDGGDVGFAIPGFRLDVVDDAGDPVPTGTEGMLAVHRGDSPLFFFDGYVGAEGQGWVGDYYLTGDAVEQNEDGSISFVGRSDDVISSAGYRIGPFDVESCLLEHDAVAESAVVGEPDDQRGEIVTAYVVLNEEYDGGELLIAELTQHVRDRLGKHAYQRDITLVESLPKTPSGKIQRFVLRNG